MEQFDIPLFKKLCGLYKNLHVIRNTIPKQDRHTIWQKCENRLLGILEDVLESSQLPKPKKLPIMERASLNLNMLRILVRLAKEVGTIKDKNYILLQADIDEIGRMLGGWIKFTKESSKKG